MGAATNLALAYRIEVDETRCDGCRACLPSCRHHALVWAWADRVLFVDPWACNGCGTCLTDCPSSALHLTLRTEP